MLKILLKVFILIFIKSSYNITFNITQMESQNQTISKAMLEQIQIEKDFQLNENLCDVIQNQNQIQYQICQNMNAIKKNINWDNQDQEQYINFIEEEDYESDQSEQYEIDSDYCSDSSNHTQIYYHKNEKLNWNQQMGNHSQSPGNQSELRFQRIYIENKSTFNDNSYQVQMQSLSINDNETILIDQQKFNKSDKYFEYGDNNLKDQKNKRAVSFFSQQQQEQDQKQTTDEKIIFQRISKSSIFRYQIGTLQRTYLFKLSQFDQKKFKGVEIKNQEGKKYQKFRLQLEEERIDQTGVNSNIIKRQVNLKKEKKLQVSRITLNAKDLILILKEMKQNLQEIIINNCKIVCQDIQERKELQRQMNNLKKLKLINLQGNQWMCKEDTKQINWQIKLEEEINQLPEINLNGFDNLTELNLSYTKIKKLELKSLPKLQKLDLSWCQQLPEINLSGFDNLTELILSYTKIKKPELKSLPKLQKLDLSWCQQLPEINLSGFDNLTQLILSNTRIKKLELKSLPKLQKLDFSGCQQLSDINLNEFDNLTQLILSYTKIKKLELKSLPKLQKLDLSGCLLLPEINLNKFDNLTELNLSYSNIKKLELKSLPKLQYINLSQCKQLLYLSLNGFYNLQQLNLSYTKIRRLKLKSLPKLQKLNFQGCKQLPQTYLSRFDNSRKLILIYGKKYTIKLKQLKQLIKLNTQKQNKNEQKSSINLLEQLIKRNNIEFKKKRLKTKSFDRQCQKSQNKLIDQTQALNQINKLKNNQIKSGKIKMREYDIYLVAQAKFDSEVQQIQKKIMNNEANCQKESSKLLNFFQETKKLKDQLQQKYLNYKPNNQLYLEEVIELLKKRLKALEQLDEQIKLLETKKKEGNIQSIIQLSSFSQMLKLQPINIEKKLERMSRLSIMDNYQGNNSSFALCVQIKDVQLKIISKIFYLALKTIQKYFNDLFQRTYGIQQSLTIVYISKIYLCLKKIIQLQTNNIDENQKKKSLDKTLRHQQKFIIASWKEAVQKIQEALSMNNCLILQQLSNQRGWTQLFSKNLECHTFQEVVQQLKLHMNNFNNLFQKHIREKACLQQHDQIFLKDLEVFIFNLNYISKLIIQTFEVRMNETASQTAKNESSNILIQQLINMSENLKENQFNLKPLNQQEFQINGSKSKKKYEDERGDRMIE